MTTTPTAILSDMLPQVFLNEKQHHSKSDIWLIPRLEFLPGKRYLLRSRSGGGKSSLCAYLNGNRDDYTGSLTIFGQEARNLRMDDWLKLRRDTIAYLPQEPGLFPTLTAMENILLKNRLTGCKSAAEISAMLDRLGMLPYADRPAGKLSIGQQQRVALVRALCQPFRLLLLDEPVSHLDDAANRAAASLVDEEAKADNATVIVTSVGNDLHLGYDKILSL